MPCVPQVSTQEYLARALLRLGCMERLKCAPAFHAVRLGPHRVALSAALERVLIGFQKQGPLTPHRERARTEVQATLADPEVCPYTPDLEREDQDTAATRPLRLPWAFQQDTLCLADPERAAQVLHAHFHPVAWPAFQDASLWDLLLEVLPASHAARPRPEMYVQDRWLYDERAQQAAETLCDRLTRTPDLLIAPVLVPPGGQRVFEDYVARLDRGTKARRWLTETLKPPKRKQAAPLSERLPHA